MACNIEGHGCMALFGTAWSVVKNNCVDLSTAAIHLNPIDLRDKSKKPAFLIFSDDNCKAEIYLPDNNSIMMLEIDSMKRLCFEKREAGSLWRNMDSTIKKVFFKAYKILLKIIIGKIDFC